MVVLFTSFQNCSKKSFTTDLASEEKNDTQNICLTNPSDPSCANICVFNGQILTDGQTVTAYQNSSVPVGSTCVSEVRKCSGGQLSGSYTYASCQVGKPAACLFNGKTIPHGGTVVAYQNSTVAFGQSCVQETRTCNNGRLSGSYSYESCAVGGPAQCLFNGRAIAHGESVIAYLNASVPFGQTCSAESRKCMNGVLSGSHPYGSCVVGQSSPCSFNGMTIANGGSVVAYQNASVPYGESCVSQTRVCSNGALSGSYMAGSCTQNQPAACSFNGQTIAHGQTITAYTDSTVPYGSSCQAQSRTCNNGTLGGNSAAIYGACSPGQPMACVIQGQTVAHGSSVTAYTSASVPFGGSCQAQTRTCHNGSLSGDAPYLSCQVAGPSTCSFNGRTYQHGDQVQTYASSVVPFGSTCPAETRTCYNGSMTGSWTATSCYVESPKGCQITLYSAGEYGDDVGTVYNLSHGQTINGYSVYSYTQRYRGDSVRCDNYRQTLQCYNGSIQGNMSFNKVSCMDIEWQNPGSPLMIHMNSNVEKPELLQFSSPLEGIIFDILGANSKPVAYSPLRIGWYKSAQYFFIALPNKNGEVKGIDELFGDNTKGPDGKFAEDGYKALAKFDQNGDTYITKEDPVFAKLRLWNDRNHDGKAQPDELVSLTEMQIEVIDLNADPNYKEIDIHGNETTLKSVVKTTDGRYHLMFDVWFRYLPLKSENP